MIGKCPDRGTILVKCDSGVFDKPNWGTKIRCPSCTNHFHDSKQLDWEQEP